MSDLSVGRVSLVEGPLTSESMNFSRRTVLASFAALAVIPGPVGSAVAATWPSPTFGGELAARTLAGTIAVNHLRQWAKRVGMLGGMAARWRALGLRARLLCYIEHHREDFGGAPSGLNIAATARLISVKADFRAWNSWYEPFDACVCGSCFFELWGRAVQMEHDNRVALHREVDQVSASGWMLGGFEPPSEGSLRQVPFDRLGLCSNTTQTVDCRGCQRVLSGPCQRVSPA